MRSDDHWGLLWEEINAFAKHEHIEILSKNTHGQRHPPSTLNEYVVTADTIGSCDETVSSSLSDHYKTSVYFATLDLVIVEMNEQFSEKNLSLMKAIDPLCPKSDSLCCQTRTLS